jgi:hypothetical protein
MFDELGNKLDSVLGKFRQRGVITEPMIRDGLREVRRVLLEADVNYKVTRQFLERVQERALGDQVIKSVSPAQQIVKIVHDELANLLGEGRASLNWPSGWMERAARLCSRRVTCTGRRRSISWSRSGSRWVYRFTGVSRAETPLR